MRNDLEMVRENGLALRFVEEQTPELCLAAVEQNGLALEYVKEQTPAICVVAVMQDIGALEFVKNKTPELKKVVTHTKVKVTFLNFITILQGVVFMVLNGYFAVEIFKWYVGTFLQGCFTEGLWWVYAWIPLSLLLWLLSLPKKQI